MMRSTLVKPFRHALALVEMYASEAAVGGPPQNDHFHGPDRVLIISDEGTTVGGDTLFKHMVDDKRFDLDKSQSYDIAISGGLSADFLGQFNTVLVSLDGFSVDDVRNMTNLLKDFVDNGGGVVLSTFWGYYQSFEGDIMSGGINSHGYNPLINGTTDAFSPVTIGQVFDPKSPIMAGVNQISSPMYHSDYLPGLDDGAHLIANWSNDRPLVAVNAAGNVANLTIFPASEPFGAGISGDFVRLFENTLDFVAGK